MKLGYLNIMKKWLAYFLVPTCGFMTLSSLSCFSNNQNYSINKEFLSDKRVKNLIEKYRNEYDSIIGEGYFQYTDIEKEKLLKLIEQYQHQINYYDTSNLNSNGWIWLESFNYELNRTKDILESNIHYLIISDESNDLNEPLSLGFCGPNSWLEKIINHSFEHIGEPRCSIISL